MVGIGTDIVAVDRIVRLAGRYGERFLGRCFRPEEVALARRRGEGEGAALAARWAAKEAFLKALGRDTAGVALRDIEVIREGSGAPGLRLHASAADALAAAGGRTVHLSLSHERRYAVAVVLVD